MKPKNSPNFTKKKTAVDPDSSKSKTISLRFAKLWNFCKNLFGKKSKKSFSAVISHLTEIYEKEGFISIYEKKMFRNIAAFGDKKVASITTPRSDIVAIRDDATLEDIRRVITNNGHTRIPVYQGNFDHIVGFIHSKDLAKFICDDGKDFSISRIMRKILFVPGSMKLLPLLMKMRTARIHIAIVLDGFGGVDGIVSIENLIEEIIGEIEDEHDIPLETAFFQSKKLGKNVHIFGGRVEIEKLEEALKRKLVGETGIETIGGLVMAIFGRMPEVGEVVEKDGVQFKVLESENRVIKSIEVKIIDTENSEEDEQNDQNS